ncbi:MAG: RNA polymerase sigma factor [Acidimicrobiales bacterium]
MAADGSLEVEERVLAGEDHGRVAVTMRALYPPGRDALLLFAGADLSYTEVVRALDIPLGTVRSRISWARAHLRELLGPRAIPR